MDYGRNSKHPCRSRCYMDLKRACIHFEDDAKLRNFTVPAIQRRLGDLRSEREKVWEGGDIDRILQKIPKASGNIGEQNIKPDPEHVRNVQLQRLSCSGQTARLVHKVLRQHHGLAVHSWGNRRLRTRRHYNERNGNPGMHQLRQILCSSVDRW